MLTRRFLVRARFLAGVCGLLCLTAGQANAAAQDCLIEPAQTIDIGPPGLGLLESITVARGDRVQRGQVVAQLHSAPEQAALEIARHRAAQRGPTQLAESKRDFSRQKYLRRKEMVAEKLMSEQERDDAEAEYKLAEAELQIAQENLRQAALEVHQLSAALDLRTLRSPFDGVVVERNAHPGETVEPGGGKKPLLRLAQLDPLHVRVVFKRDYFGLVKPGMKAGVFPEINFRGKAVGFIKQIDRMVDPASGTFVATLELPNPRLEIPAGVKCTAYFMTLPEPPSSASSPSRK